MWMGLRLSMYKRDQRGGAFGGERFHSDSELGAEFYQMAAYVKFY
jgi:hypothetical protein